MRAGTIFERSHVPLHKWIYAMYLVVTARKGISSMQLAKEIGVTQKTAWFILGRLREVRLGRLLAEVRRPVPAIDSLLAATALRYELRLVTRNAGDFEYPGLEVINPWAGN